MKEITKKRWGRFGWFCMSFVPMLGYLVLMLGVSTALMSLIGAVAVMGGIVGPYDLYDYLLEWTMPISVVYAVLGLIGFGLWYYFGCKRKKLRFPKEILRPARAAALVLVAFGGQFIAGYLVWLIELVSPQVVENYVELMETSGIADLTWVSFLYAVILGPIVEELVFRGVTFFYAKKVTRRFWLANIIQALAFGIMHMNLVQGIYAFMLGLILGWIYQRFHSLYASIIVHILFNFLGTCVLENVENLLGDSLILGILWNLIGIAAFVAGMVLLGRKKNGFVEEV